MRTAAGIVLTPADHSAFVCDRLHATLRIVSYWRQRWVVSSTFSKFKKLMRAIRRSGPQAGWGAPGQRAVAPPRVVLTQQDFTDLIGSYPRVARFSRAAFYLHLGPESLAFSELDLARRISLEKTLTSFQRSQRSLRSQSYRITPRG